MSRKSIKILEFGKTAENLDLFKIQKKFKIVKNKLKLLNDNKRH